MLKAFKFLSAQTALIPHDRCPRVDDQLHFITSGGGAAKSVPFADLDVQATTDLLEKHRFKFRLRDEPIEQWLRHNSKKK